MKNSIHQRDTWSRFSSFIFTVLLSSFLISCSTLQRSSSGDEDDIDADEPIEISSEFSHDDYEVHTSDIVEESSADLPEKLPIKSHGSNDDISRVPMVSNKHVDKWIHFFQNRGRDMMTRYLQRAARYTPMMKEVLRSHNLPEELVYVALIESGFSARAHSRANAVGYWQFLRGTAKDFGLRVNGYVDERRDPVLATHAAAKYLKGVYHVFGNWYLAMASYNVGHNRLKGVVMRHHTRDFWELVRRKKLPSETRNYVPKFLAAWQIAENPAKFGFTNLAYQEPLSYEELRLAKPISLSAFARHSRVSLSTLKSLNPAIKSDYVPATRKGRSFRVPIGKKSLAQAALSKSGVRAAAQVAGVYRVRRGDNLSVIARRHGTSVSTLLRLNGLSRRSVIRVGQRIKLPGHSSAKVSSSKKVARAAASKRRPSTYRVVRGDNLTHIARRHGISLRELQQANGMRRGATLRIGQKLKIPGSGKSAQTVHRVRRGDTLIGIARKYGVSLAQLRRQNRLSRSSKIYVGTKLQIPARL